MAKDDWYVYNTFYDIHDPKKIAGYQAVKFGPEGEPKGAYTLSATGSTCDCPAHVPYCRHKKMLVIFKDKNRLDTGYQYNIDKDEWKDPVNIPGLDGMDPIAPSPLSGESQPTEHKVPPSPPITKG